MSELVSEMGELMSESGSGADHSGIISIEDNDTSFAFDTRIGRQCQEQAR